MTKIDEKELRKIKDRIFRGQKYWKDENETKFKRFRNYLRVKHWPNGKPNNDCITVPYIHALLRAKMPFLYYRNPEIIVEPNAKMPSPEIAEITVKNIDSVRATMNYLPDEIGIEREMKRVVQDYTAFGRGVMKIGFEYEYEGGEKKKGFINSTIDKFKDMVGIETAEPEEIKILVDRFYGKRISYPDGYFIYDPEAKYGLSDSRFCAEKIVEPLEDVKSNKNFQNTADLKSNCSPKNGLGYGDNKDEIKGEELLEYFIYWPKDKYGNVTKCIYIVPDQDIVLWVKDKPYEHKDFPYEELNNYETPDYLFPLGDIEPVEDQQNELDALESLHFRHAKSFNQKYVYNKGKLTSAEISALQSPDNSFCQINEDAGLRALENPSINQSIPMGTAMLKEDMTKILAVSEYDTAYVPRTETTLGEAQMVQGGSNNRKADSRKSVEEFAQRVFTKLFQVVQEYMTEETLVKITNAEGQIEWINMSGEDIQGQYKFKIQPYSASPMDADKLRKDAIDLMKVMSNDPTLPIAAKNQLRKWVLDSFDKKDTTAFETTTTPPGQEGLDNEPVVDENGNPIPNTVPVSPEEAAMSPQGAQQ